MHGVLVLVDIQNDYFPGGKMELAGATAAGANAQLLLRAFRAARLPVIHVQHVSLRPGSTFFLPDTPGVQIHPCVAPQPGEPVLVKHFPNSFRDTPLLERLRELGPSHLTFAGMMTHMCIDTTVRAAFDLGFTCALAGDACATRALEFAGRTVPAEAVQAAFLAALGSVFARVAPAQELLPPA